MAWFKRPPDPDQHREEFLLKLFFTDASTRKIMEQHCKRKLKEMKEQLQILREIETLKELAERPYWLKTLRHGLAHLELDISLLGEKNE